MKNITEQFNSEFKPMKALLIFQREQDNENNSYYQHDGKNEIYVESYDIGKYGKPINAHPLTVKEMIVLSELLQTTQDLKGGHLKSRGILPAKILYVNPGANGYAIWHTPPQEANLFFTESLNISTGKAKIPAMVWKATADKLSVYAVKGKARPTIQTCLQHAPFFNIYNNGNVCMGTVKIDIGQNTALEDFMDLWESYFFNSYFSHSINGGCSTKTDTASIWRTLIGSEMSFPQDELRTNGLTIKHLIA